MILKRKTAKIGDIFQILTSEGVCYGQVINIHPTFDFGKEISTYVKQGEAGVPTRYGKVHYGKKGVHIVPYKNE